MSAYMKPIIIHFHLIFKKTGPSGPVNHSLSCHCPYSTIQIIQFSFIHLLYIYMKSLWNMLFCLEAPQEFDVSMSSSCSTEKNKMDRSTNIQ